MAKYKVLSEIRMGPEEEGGPDRVFKRGDTVDLTADQAEAIAWAVEVGEKPKSLKERRAALEAAQRELEAEEAKARKHARSPAGKKERQAALDSIKNRPDNPASGQPSIGRIPDEDVAAFERAQDPDLADDDAATEHGFGREPAGGKGSKTTATTT